MINLFCINQNYLHVVKLTINCYRNITKLYYWLKTYLLPLVTKSKLCHYKLNQKQNIVNKTFNNSFLSNDSIQ